jgi:predicted MFS family arabinose efflux permease
MTIEESPNHGPGLADPSGRDRATDLDSLGQPRGVVPPGGLVALLTVGAFVVFAQAFMIAPILPRLARVFATSPNVVGLAVPAYLLPYGAMTLVWGPLSDRFGRRPVIVVSLVAFTLLSATTVLAHSAAVFIALRVATAVGASGVVPASLALVGDLIPFVRRGRALGWLFGGMAGGMAIGSTAGALAEPSVGWTGLFLTAAGTGVVLAVAAALVLRSVPTARRPPTRRSLRALAAGYRGLLRTGRGRRTYGYVLINAMLHSGIYTWLGLYLQRRFGLGEAGIGLALLGYGVSGFCFGPTIGHLADRYGRARLIPTGVAVGATCALLLAAPLPLAAVAATVTALSLGYDLTQPSLGAIVTDLPANRGQAMGLNVFTLFTGFGSGSLLFQALLPLGFTAALAAFGLAAAGAAALAPALFKSEQPLPQGPLAAGSSAEG